MRLLNEEISLEEFEALTQIYLGDGLPVPNQGLGANVPIEASGFAIEDVDALRALKASQAQEPSKQRARQLPSLIKSPGEQPSTESSSLLSRLRSRLDNH